MTKSTKQKLAYQKEYNASPEQKARRAELGRARYALEKEGKIGKGQDVGHRVAAANGGHVTKSNAKVESASDNRGWRKDGSYKVPNKK